MAVPFIPSTVTLTIAPTFSPPTTCFQSTAQPTYTLGTINSVVSDRIVLRPFQTQCYPYNPSGLALTPLASPTGSAPATTTVSWFSATTCPPGYSSASGELTSSTSHVWCCPPGPFTVQPVGVQDYSGCMLTPTMPVTLVNGTTTTTLATPTNEPYGISYRPLEIVFMNNETTPTSSTTTSNSGLSTGAQAGIGVGVSLGVIIFALAGYLIWRNLNKKKTQQTKDASNAEKGSEPTEVPGEGHAVHEMGHHEVLEASDKRHSRLPASYDVAKDKQAILAELEGDMGGHEAPVYERPGELSTGEEKDLR